MIRLCQILECSAIATYDSQKFAYRDVKPSNILLGDDSELLLTDFDLVATGDTTGFTKGSGAIGSGSWYVPELSIAPDTADARANLFSIAMTGIFVLHKETFNNYFFRDNREEFVHKLTDDAVLLKCIVCATASDLNDRFQSLSNFRFALSGDTSKLPTARTKPHKSGRNSRQDIRT